MLVSYVPTNLNSQKLAHDLLEVLRKAGWNNVTGEDANRYTIPPTGLSVGVRDVSNAPPEADLFLRSL